MFIRVRVVPLISCTWWFGSQLIYLFLLCFGDSFLLISVILTFSPYWLSVFDQAKALIDSSLFPTLRDSQFPLSNLCSYL